MTTAARILHMTAVGDEMIDAKKLRINTGMIKRKSRKRIKEPRPHPSYRLNKRYWDDIRAGHRNWTVANEATLSTAISFDMRMEPSKLIAVAAGSSKDIAPADSRTTANHPETESKQRLNRVHCVKAHQKHLLSSMVTSEINLPKKFNEKSLLSYNHAQQLQLLQSPQCFNGMPLSLLCSTAVTPSFCNSPSEHKQEPHDSTAAQCGKKHANLRKKSDFLTKPNSRLGWQPTLCIIPPRSVAETIAAPLVPTAAASSQPIYSSLCCRCPWNTSCTSEHGLYIPNVAAPFASSTVHQQSFLSSYSPSSPSSTLSFQALNNTAFSLPTIPLTLPLSTYFPVGDLRNLL